MDIVNEKIVVSLVKEEKDLKEDYEVITKKYDSNFVFLILEEELQVKMTFASRLRIIRATEIMEYLIPEFGLVKGNSNQATGYISKPILKSKMVDAEIEDVTKYFEARIKEYRAETKYIVAKEYATQCEEEIRNLPQYTKKNVRWAMVKSTEIAPDGEIFSIKSLENESGIRIVADEKTYIMVGKRGEVYNISAEKFENTYEISGEQLDIFEEMLDYIPEAKLEATGEHIAIDELARICYPKGGTKIYVKQLQQRTKVFQGDGQGDYFLGREGDYMVIRAEDIFDIYIIKKEIFASTYEPAIKE